MNQQEKLNQLQFLLRAFQDYPRYQNSLLETWTIDQFHKLPIVSKYDLAQDTIPRKHICFVSRTSGTTQQLIVTHSLKAYQSLLLRGKYSFDFAHLTAQDTVGILFPICIESPGRHIEDILKNHMGAGAFPVDDLANDHSKEKVLQLVRDVSPTAVIGYTNQMVDFFSFLSSNQHHIKTCLMGGEIITQTFHEQMQKLYHIDMYNVYGTTEFGIIGVGALNTTGFLDLIEHGLWIEVLQDDGSVSETGEGDILITDLENTSMPFIRYRLGDRVKIIQQEGKKKIQIVSRSTGTFLYGTEIFALSMLESTTKAILQSTNFFYLIQKDPGTYKDIMTLYIDIAYKDRLKEVKMAIRHKFDFGELFFVKTFSGSWPKIFTGKRRYLIDRRDNQ